MGAATTLVTVQEFLAMPEIEGQRRELIGGEVVTMGYAKARHEIVKANLIQILAVWLARNPIGKLFSEATFLVDEHNAFIPDLCIGVPARMAIDEGWFTGSPEIAIEVVSSETATQLEKKIKLYFAHGAKSVWVAYPEHRSVHVFDPAGASKRFQDGETLEDLALPGFSTRVCAIFEQI